MGAKRIFYVTSSDLTAVYCDKGQVRLLGRFDLTDEGVAAFAALLKQDPDHPSAFIVDVIEEEFRIENIPHVTGSDRDGLLERKATALFHAATYTSAQVIGREREGRRDDQVLFSALNKADVLDRWLSEIRAAKVPLVGVYSVAILTGMLIGILKIRHANTLVLTVQNGRLLRQSFFSKGKLKLSRLTPMSAQDSDSYLKNMLSEVDRNKRYLGRLQMLDFKEPMEVYILTEGRQLQLLQTGCNNDAQTHYHFLDINEIATRLGLKQMLGADECEWSLAYMLNRRQPAGNYVAAKERNYYTLFRLRRMMVAASFSLAAMATFWSGVNIYSGQNLALQTAQTEAATRQVAAHLAAEELDYRNFAYTPQAMRAVVEADRQLTQHKPSPLRILSCIGASMGKHPNIELDQLKWGVSQENADAGGDGQGAVAVAVTETATIKGHLKTFPGNYQAAFQQVEALIKSLGDNPGIAHVQAISLPLNTDPASLLVGESRRNGELPLASFELEVRLKGGQS